MDSFKRFNEEKLPDKECFYSPVKDETTNDNWQKKNPLALEKFAITYDILSDYCKRNADKYGTKIGDVKKLIPNLIDKTNYVLRYRNLQFYLSLGMKLTKIHKVLKFK